MNRDVETRHDAVVDLTDSSRSAKAAARARPQDAAPAPPAPRGRPTLDDLVHPHDAERLVALILEASRRRQDTFVRVRNDDAGWIEVRCSFVPVDRSEGSDR